MNKHDAHYREIEKTGVEPIVEMEGVICRDLPPELHAIARRNLSLAMATKHRLRAGKKGPPEMDLEKARNYEHRARTGRWL